MELMLLIELAQSDESAGNSCGQGLSINRTGLQTGGGNSLRKCLNVGKKRRHKKETYDLRKSFISLLTVTKEKREKERKTDRKKKKIKK